MVRTSWIVVVLASVAVCVLLLWSLGLGELPVQTPARSQAEAGAAAPVLAAVDVAHSAAIPASVREASSAPHPGSATDADQPVITVKVVDGATELPVAGADVSFLTAAGEGLCAALPWPEQSVLLRNPELLARRFGTTVTTDADGLATGAPTWGTEITARLGERYGSCHFFAADETPPGGYRIVLDGDRSVAVQVVGVDGQPVFGIPVATAVYRTDGTRLRWLRHAGAESVAPDGLAVLCHLQVPAYDEVAPQLAADEELRAVVDLPGCDEPSAPFSLAAPPLLPLVLVVPPLGSLGVVPPPGFEDRIDRVVCMAADAGAVPRPHEQQPKNGQEARFPRVAVGKDYVVKADFATGRGAGPAVAGGHAVVRLGLPDDLCHCVGTAMGPDGRPLVSTELHCEANLDRRGTGPVHTDAEGRFHLLFAVSGGRLLEWLRLRSSAGTALQAEVGPFSLLPGHFDLGIVHFEVPPLLAAGRIHGLSAVALADCGLVVEQFHAWENTPSAWHRRAGLIDRIAADGSFSVYGKVGDGDLRLHLGEFQALREGPVAFVVGEQDVRLEVEVAKHLQATVLLPAAFPDDVLGELKSPGGGALRPESRFVRRSSERDGERAILEWMVSPGVYDLTVRARGFPEPLVQIRSVRHDDGPADPRLADIDLRGKVAVLDITVHDVAGAPLDAQVAGLSSTHLSTMGRMWVSDGHAQLLVPCGPLDLFVFEYGYHPAELRAVQGKVAVVMQPWESTEFVLVGAPPLPADCTFVLDSNTQPGTVWRNEDPSAWRTARGDREDVVDGRVRLVFGSGHATLQLLVHHTPSRREVVVPGLVPERVQHRAEPIALQVPAASVAAALRELLAGK